MSEAVIGFQIAIIISIWIANSYSEEARDVAVGLWVLETFIFVWFMSPLMLIQLGTITIMYFLTDEIWRGMIAEMLVTLLGYIFIAAVIIALVYWGYVEFIKESKPPLTQEQECTINGNLWEYNKKATQWRCIQLYSLYIESNPRNARIQIMNIKPKYYRGIKLRSGKYTIRVSKNGYYTENFYVNFNESGTYNSTLTPKY